MDSEVFKSLRISIPCLMIFLLSYLHRFEVCFCRFAVEANQLDVLAMRGVQRMGVVVTDILETHLDLFKRYILRVPQEKARILVLLYAVVLAGAQIVQPAVPFVGLGKCHTDILESHVLNRILRIAVDQHAVFALAGNIIKPHVFDLAGVRVLIAVKGGQYDRLGRAPPIRAEAACFDHNVGILHVFHIAAVADLNGQPAVGATNDAVVHKNIAEIAHALRADLDRRRGGNERAAADQDIFARPVFRVALGGFQADAVVRALDVTAQNAHIRAVIGVDAVGIRDVQVIENADLRDQHIVAPCRVQRPERRIGNGDIAE